MRLRANRHSIRQSLKQLSSEIAIRFKFIGRTTVQKAILDHIDVLTLASQLPADIRKPSDCIRIGFV